MAEIFTPVAEPVEARIAAIRKRAEAATPDIAYIDGDYDAKDAELFINARADILWLLDVLTSTREA